MHGLTALLHYNFPACVERIRVFNSDELVVDAILMTTVMARGWELCQHQRLHVVGCEGGTHGTDFVDISTMILGREGDSDARIDLSATTDLTLPKKARGFRLGTLLVRRSIRFAHRHGDKNAQVSGITLSDVDAADPENRARRDRLWTEAGYLASGLGGPLSQFNEKPDPNEWGSFRMQIDTLDARAIAGMFVQASRKEVELQDARKRAKDASDRFSTAVLTSKLFWRRLVVFGFLLGAVVGATGMWRLLG
jgi:hypothetical protein